MQTTPSSVGNNVKLAPLDIAVNSFPYLYGFVKLSEVEPSLGIPNGISYVSPNSAYYFPAFAATGTYVDSRKFTGKDNLVFVNKNIGFNNLNPTFNIDINGSLRALSALILNLSAVNIVPASGNNVLNFNYSNGVVFNTNLSANYNTYLNNVTANNLFVNNITAKRQIYEDQYTVYNFNSVNVTTDATINGYVSANNVYVQNNTFLNTLCAISGIFNSVTGKNVTVTDSLSVQNNIYANQIYGQVQIDPFSGLYYDSQNRLSFTKTQDIYLAVRPSDSYSTDDYSTPRNANGQWDGIVANSNQSELANVARPYFKTLNGAYNYIYANGINGNNLTIYIDEDIVEGERLPNYFTPEQSGQYSGCTYSGNLTGGFFSTEWLGAHYPALTAAGMLGGDFLWPIDNTALINGNFSYVTFEELEFNNVYISGRFDASITSPTNQLSYSTDRQYNKPPRKISFRTYVCADPNLSYGQFYHSTPTISAWVTPKTNPEGIVQGRQISFNVNTNLGLQNLNFEFITNSTDSSGLIFYDGYVNLANITISLLGSGIYTYGALYLNSNLCHMIVSGYTLGDPYLYKSYSIWNAYYNNWIYQGLNSYNFGTSNYFPGYGLAIIGNNSNVTPTVINYGYLVNSRIGFINANNGSFYDQTDYGTNRYVGHFSNLNSSLILDGCFNATDLYNVIDNSRIQGNDQLFLGDTFALSSRNINSRFPPTYILSFNDDSFYDFRYINFGGAFSTFNMQSIGYTTWQFVQTDRSYTDNSTYYLSVNNNENNQNYVFLTNNTIDLTNSIASIGNLNSIGTNKSINQNTTQTTIAYCGTNNVNNYKQYYTLSSPLENNPNVKYTLSYYSSSVR
jgi:hypothetical protein